MPNDQSRAADPHPSAKEIYLSEWRKAKGWQKAFIIVLAVSAIPTSILALKDWMDERKSDEAVQILYKLWHVKNTPEAGRYEDELIDGKLLYRCQANGNHPAYFGKLTIRQTFDLIAIRDPKPTSVYISGIDWGDRMQVWIAPAESGGKGPLGWLKIIGGCEIPAGLQAKE